MFQLSKSKLFVILNIYIKLIILKNEFNYYIILSLNYLYFKYLDKINYFKNKFNMLYLSKSKLLII